MREIDEAEGLFQDTCDEVETFFNFLNETIEKSPTLNFAGKTREFDSNVINTMKASAYMMLYNLIEATTDKVFRALHEDIKQADFDDLLPELKYYLLRSFKNMKKDITEQTITAPSPIAKTLHQVALDNLKLFSGNIDVRKIKDTAKKYGLTIQQNHTPEEDESRSAHLLKEVKNTRNAIGHGDKSFNEVGKGTSIEELMETKERVINYLNNLLASARIYLDQQQYCHIAAHAPERIAQ